MSVEIVTREDLERFRIQLLSDIRHLFASTGAGKEKEWLKNSEVRKLLKVSDTTIQRLRIGGKLKSSKVGGIHYYRKQDIEKLLETGLA